jgi:ubiquinone/menaquinone biosynthesis C-methylase UbiE
MDTTGKKPWERETLPEQLLCLVGWWYGPSPENAQDLIREGKREWYEFLAQFSGLSSTDEVLEVGSGMGWGSVHIAPQVKRLYCSDVSRSFLQHAREVCRQHSNTSFHEIQSAKFAFLGDRSVDAVIASAVFIHFDLFDIYWHFAEFQRILRPGGRVAFDFMSADGINFAADQLFRQNAEIKAACPDDLLYSELMKWNSFGAVVNAASAFGFSLQRRHTVNLNQELVRFERVTSGR